MVNHIVKMKMLLKGDHNRKELVVDQEVENNFQGQDLNKNILVFIRAHLRIKINKILHKIFNSILIRIMIINKHYHKETILSQLSNFQTLKSSNSHQNLKEGHKFLIDILLKGKTDSIFQLLKAKTKIQALHIKTLNKPFRDSQLANQ